MAIIYGTRCENIFHFSPYISEIPSQYYDNNDLIVLWSEFWKLQTHVKVFSLCNSSPSFYTRYSLLQINVSKA